VHGTPSQQSPETEQICPYSAQLGLVEPPSVVVVPPSLGGGGVVVPQVPLVAPVGMMHASPEQQSACVVHSPGAWTHVPWHLLFTHGSPQQSALVAQLVPAAIGLSQVFALRRQRGIPSASLRQQLSGFLLQ
jgi:hypothetical protein